jgi:hypothetical protein
MNFKILEQLCPDKMYGVVFIREYDSVKRIRFNFTGAVDIACQKSFQITALCQSVALNEPLAIST